jgi:hypothetical protein
LLFSLGFFQRRHLAPISEIQLEYYNEYIFFISFFKYKIDYLPEKILTIEISTGSFACKVIEHKDSKKLTAS